MSDIDWAERAKMLEDMDTIDKLVTEIERLQARVEELEGDLNIMRLQRDATHVSRCPKCAATEQETE